MPRPACRWLIPDASTTIWRYGKRCESAVASAWSAAFRRKSRNLDQTTMTPDRNPTIIQPVDDEEARNKIPAAGDPAAQWAESCLVYPIYAALATQFGFLPLPHPDGELPPSRPAKEVFDRDTKWLDEIDGKIRAFQIRQLPAEILNASEPGLNALIQRQLRKPEKTEADRDKIDLLLVQYFALCASAGLCRGN